MMILNKRNAIESQLENISNFAKKYPVRSYVITYTVSVDFVSVFRSPCRIPTSKYLNIDQTSSDEINTSLYK